MSKRILIAEDEPGARAAMTIFATMQGYDVIAVDNGVDLLTIAFEERFDVVITDLMMADLDGASATEIMKMQGNMTPVIAITGLPAGELSLIKDKFTRIYHKPCDFKELFDYIETLVGK
jgi:DNA-binding response OmpR family regulator